VGAGFSGSVAQAPMKASAAAIRTSFWVFISSPVFVFRDEGDLSTSHRLPTSRFLRKTPAF
jgi:hypothetical protein